jgi:hypothetical protein
MLYLTTASNVIFLSLLLCMDFFQQCCHDGPRRIETVLETFYCVTFLHFLFYCNMSVISNLVFNLFSYVSVLYIPLSTFLHPEDTLSLSELLASIYLTQGCHNPECHKQLHRHAYLNSSVYVHDSRIHCVVRLTTGP